MKLTQETLEEFLNEHMEKPLPEWFPTKEQWREGDYAASPLKTNLKTNSIKTDSIFMHVDHIADSRYLDHGLTVLPYLRGKIALVEAGEIVVSYPFSGCYMAAFSFTENPGKTYVGHITVGDGGVKDELINFFQTEENINRPCLFEPFSLLVISNEKTGQQFLRCGEQLYTRIWDCRCWGFITRSMKCYSVIIGKNPEENQYYVMLWTQGDQYHCTSRPDALTPVKNDPCIII